MQRTEGCEIALQQRIYRLTTVRVRNGYSVSPRNSGVFMLDPLYVIEKIYQ